MTTAVTTATIRPWRLDCHVAAGDDGGAADELRRSLSAARPTISPMRSGSLISATHLAMPPKKAR